MTNSPPQDFSPLAYGAALALGALMLLGVPTATVKRTRAVDGEERVGAAASAGGQDARELATRTRQLLRERRAQTAAARP